MTSVGIRAGAGLVFLLLVLAAALFVAAGTLAYWQGWAFLAVFGTATGAISLDLARRDPELLARRVRAVWRLNDEEKYLVAQLSGYDAYRQRVTHRLIPGIW
jgi:protein-S-isoprenylcysteine O-methyltransferase Ste14